MFTDCVPSQALLRGMHFSYCTSYAMKILSNGECWSNKFHDRLMCLKSLERVMLAEALELKRSVGTCILEHDH